MLEQIMEQLRIEYLNKYGVWNTTNSSDLTIRGRLDEIELEYGKSFIWSEIEVDDKYSVISVAYSDNDGIDITNFIVE